MSWASCLRSEKVYHFSGSGVRAGPLCSRDGNKARESGGKGWSLSGDHVSESLSGHWRPWGRTEYFILFVVDATEGLWQRNYCELIHILKGSLPLNIKYGQWWLWVEACFNGHVIKSWHWHYLWSFKKPTSLLSGHSEAKGPSQHRADPVPSSQSHHGLSRSKLSRMCLGYTFRP